MAPLSICGIGLVVLAVLLGDVALGRVGEHGALPDDEEAAATKRRIDLSGHEFSDELSDESTYGDI